MKSKFRAYYVEVIRLGLAITVREAQFCFRFCVPLGRVPAKVMELRQEGFSRGPKVAKHKRGFGEFDPRKRRHGGKVPKCVSEIPIGGYLGMQNDTRLMREERLGKRTVTDAPLSGKAKQADDKMRQIVARKDWDPPDGF